MIIAEQLVWHRPLYSYRIWAFLLPRLGNRLNDYIDPPVDSATF